MIKEYQKPFFENVGMRAFELLKDLEGVNLLCYLLEVEISITLSKLVAI